MKVLIISAAGVEDIELWYPYLRLKDFMEEGKPIAALCHGPQILLSAGVLQGRHSTSWPAQQDDMRAAGACWEDKEVIVEMRRRAA